MGSAAGWFVVVIAAGFKTKKQKPWKTFLMKPKTLSTAVNAIFLLFAEANGLTMAARR